MQALDTNILLRFLLRDDVAQCAKVTGLFNAAATRGRVYVINSLVLLELVWVLENVYTYPRAEILGALEALDSLPSVEFADGDRVYRFLHLARTTPLGLEDLLIGLESERIDAAPTITFDRAAAKSPLFAKP
jgi:predicted nucleic-acid-binding protein